MLRLINISNDIPISFDTIQRHAFYAGIPLQRSTPFIMFMELGTPRQKNLAELL